MLYRQTFTAVGLSELDVVAPTTGTYVVQVSQTTPLFGRSALITLLKVNSTTKYTSAAGDKGFTQEVAAIAGDIIKITMSSTSADDNASNAVKTSVAITMGNL